MARCLICGEADGACGAAPLEKPVLGEETNRHVGPNGDVIDAAPQPPAAEKPVAGPVADVQVDD